MNRIVLALVVLTSVFGLSALPQETGASQPLRHEAAEGKSSPFSKAWQEEAMHSAQFDRNVAEAVMQRLAEGLRGHSATRTEALFQLDRFEPGTAARIGASFDAVERFDVYYKIQDTSTEAAGGVVVADFDLQSTPRDPYAAPQHKHAGLRLTLERIPADAPSGQWRIVAATPAHFLFE